jgi:acyl dehydratase
LQDETETLFQQLQRTVGQQQTFTSEKPIGRAAFRMYADAIDDPNPLYTDSDAARSAGLPNVIAPPTLLTDTFRFYGDAINEGGLPSALEQQSVGAPIRAGNSYRFFRRVHPSDVITATRKVIRVWQKQGRSGALTFQEVEITYRNQHDELLAVNTEVVCYREPVEGNEAT